MSFYLKIGFLSFLLLAFTMHTCVNTTSVAAAESKENTNPTDSEIVEPIPEMTSINDNVFEDNSEITRQVLITHCGSCHQSTLDTHKAGAIAVFDLDKNASWHTNLSEHHLPGITNRTQNKGEITDEQKEAITVFLELKKTQLEK